MQPKNNDKKRTFGFQFNANSKKVTQNKWQFKKNNNKPSFNFKTPSQSYSRNRGLGADRNDFNSQNKTQQMTPRNQFTFHTKPTQTLSRKIEYEPRDEEEVFLLKNLIIFGLLNFREKISKIRN